MDLNQVLVEVSNFDDSVEFYQTLGLRLIVSARGEYARFEMPSGSTTFSLYLKDAPILGNTVLYFEVDDVDRNYAELLEKGVKFDCPPTDQIYRWRTARFRDPSGNQLCLFHAGLDRRFPPWRLEQDPAA